jgi:hypothetical protein
VGVSRALLMTLTALTTPITLVTSQSLITLAISNLSFTVPVSMEGRVELEIQRLTLLSSTYECHHTVLSSTR